MDVISLPLLATAPVQYATGAEMAVPWARIALAFFICIALAAAAIYVLRQRYGRAAAPRGFAELLSRKEQVETELEILERLRATPTGQLCLVRCGERRYLIHLGQQNCTLIERLDDAQDRP